MLCASNDLLHEWRILSCCWAMEIRFDEHFCYEKFDMQQTFKAFGKQDGHPGWKQDFDV